MSNANNIEISEVLARPRIFSARRDRGRASRCNSASKPAFGPFFGCFFRRGGFTLIELMIVLSIVGVLAAIAIPAYSAFVARAQFSEAMTLAGGLKTAVGEVYGDRSTLVGINNGVGAIPATGDVSGEYVTSMDVKNGVITIHFSDDSRLAGAVAALQPKPTGGSLAWSCRTTASSSKTPGTCEAVGQIVPVEPDSGGK